MKSGDAFLIALPGARTSIPHLWILLSDPDPLTSLCVMVSVTTLRNNQDQTVVLRKGDHPFIHHDSAIFFGDARIVETTRLQAYVTAGMAISQSPCAPSVLALLRQGLLASPYTPNKILTFCKQAWKP